MKMLCNLLNAFNSFSIVALEYPDKVDIESLPKLIPKCLKNFDASFATELPDGCKKEIRERFTEVSPKIFRNPKKAEEFIFKTGEIMLSADKDVAKRLRRFVAELLRETTAVNHDEKCYEEGVAAKYLARANSKVLAREIFHLMGAIHQTTISTTPGIVSFIEPLKR